MVSVEDTVELAKGVDGNGNSYGDSDDGNGDGNSNGNGAGADGNSNSNGNGNDASDDGNEDGNGANNEKEMQQRPCCKWEAKQMFWDDTPISNPEDGYEEDEPIGVNEEHLYGVVDLESQKEGTGGNKTAKECQVGMR